MKKVISTLILLALFVAVPKNSYALFDIFEKIYDGTFYSIYKKEFMKSCAKEADDDEDIKICECCRDESIEQLTVQQLHSADYVDVYVRENILDSCIKKVSG